MKTRNLAIIFVTLLAVYLLSKLFTGNREQTFDPDLVSIDTTAVTSIHLMPKAEQGRTIVLDRTQEGWTAAMGDRKVPAAGRQVQGVLASLVDLNSKRIVSKSQDKWSTYEVTDSATRVTAYQGEDILADLYIGGFKFDQARRSASTYVRLAGEENVHLVEGFISMQFNQGFDAFRDKQILTLDHSDVTKVTLTRSGNDPHAIQKIDGQWYYAGMEALDSTAATRYVTGLSNVLGNTFAEGFDPAARSRVATLEVELASRALPLVVECYESADSAKPFVFHGSQNPDGYFLADSASTYKQLVGKFEDLVPVDVNIEQ